MSLVFRIFKSGADTTNANNVLFQGDQQATVHAFMASFAPGSVISNGEYIALNHDDSGKYSDSPVVPFPAFKTKLQAQAPAGLDSQVDTDSNNANSNASDSTAPASQAPASSDSSNASSSSNTNLFASNSVNSSSANSSNVASN